MKKCFLILVVCILLGFGFWKGYQIFHGFQSVTEQSDLSVLGDQSKPHVTVMLVFEDVSATYSGIPATTPFEALQTVATDHHIPLQTKTYDFGIFVEGIGDKPTHQDHAWLYFVNGVSGDVAADKKAVQTGDLIEWRYMKPMF